MAHLFSLIPVAVQNQQAVVEILGCNEKTRRYGLTLSQADARQLVETRSRALISNGRVEFGGGIIDKLILKFRDSPYLFRQNYVDTLDALIETFYYFKNESLDELSDDALLDAMKTYFDHNCAGSVELLQNRELERLARNIRFGYSPFAREDEGEEGEDKA